MTMHFIVISANHCNIEIPAFVTQKKQAAVYHETELRVAVILHDMPRMVQPDVMNVMVQQWKASFHPSELPIRDSMDDALDAFLKWLEEQPFGYVIPKTRHNLTSLPIYDVVDSVFA